MIFNLHPAFGLLPLFLYIILAFKKGMHPIINVGLCTIFGAILMKYNLLDFGNLVKNSMGSSLAFVSVIVMSATGLSAVLKATGVSELIVHFIMDKVGVRSEKQAILAAMLSTMVMAFLLGTWTGATSVIAPIIIPIVAAVGLSRSTLGIIFFGAGELGFFAAPTAAPALVVMELTGLSWPQYFLTVGLPLGIAMFASTYLGARFVQKRTRGGIDAFSDDDNVINEKFSPDKKTKTACGAFLITLLIGIVTGMIIHGGVTFTLVIVLCCAFVTGFAARMPVMKIVENILEGRKMWYIFWVLTLFDPFINFVMQSGGFDWIASILSPLMNVAGKTGFSLISVLIGIFGVNGAHVAQTPLINSLFGSVAQSVGLSTALWALCLTIGTQITSYAYPGVDTTNQLAIAHADPSVGLKWLMKVAYFFAIPFSILVTLIMSFIL